ncbi:SDR family oxidoreductase [Delftia sp. PS-11]|uniref:SDR family oxidoreductase n=1 Tax=Delftia sp. PS-11 TaxID=2767222 RepID=UPI0024579B77|nr:SDR family oxidoreductase [Delftia sp. PS-11]KAJ8743645.1 SDR family oxidoreductase [Delftia sp. PS-11]
MALTLVMGASRGLGLALVRAYVAQGRRVVATVRNAADRERVQAEGAQVLQVDFGDPASVSGLAWQLDGEKIALALYVAGLWDAHGAAQPPTREQFDRIMHTNVLGAMQVLPQVAPLVEAAGGVFGLFSSEMSLLAQADSDAWLYRVSKAALNMVVASAQPQWPGATVVAVDPGWVQTDMGGAGATFTVAQSVQGLVRTLAGVTPADRGRMLRHDGQRIGW